MSTDGIGSSEGGGGSSLCGAGSTVFSAATSAAGVDSPTSSATASIAEAGPSTFSSASTLAVTSVIGGGEPAGGSEAAFSVEGVGSETSSTALSTVEIDLGDGSAAVASGAVSAGVFSALVTISTINSLTSRVVSLIFSGSAGSAGKFDESTGITGGTAMDVASAGVSTDFSEGEGSGASIVAAVSTITVLVVSADSGDGVCSLGMEGSFFGASSICAVSSTFSTLSTEEISVESDCPSVVESLSWVSLGSVASTLTSFSSLVVSVTTTWGSLSGLSVSGTSFSVCFESVGVSTSEPFCPSASIGTEGCSAF